MTQQLMTLSDRISYLTPVGPTDRPILMSVSGDRHTLMIDGGNSKAHAELFLEKLKDEGKPLPDLTAVTHWHWDHSFGLAALSIPSIASEDTKKAMKELINFSWDDAALDERVASGVEIQFCADAIREEFKEHRDIKVVLPSITFKDELTVDLGGVTCVLKQVGSDHAKDSTVVYVKEEKLLFLGDVTAPLMYAPVWHFTAEETLKLLDQLDQFDADTYVISHYKPISKAEYQQEAALLRKAAALVTEHRGDLDQMKTGLSTFYNRPLIEDEIDILIYFANGVPEKA
ncbi:MBL fold metallo-hydrolase [Jeotgalibacillus terrae]|uniref:MBL fold metallo-hydrolase n=1 Tax=Jeotgalibacillus terrae TaxID=587735 RepID=A0ABW5ZFY5_9BACL|nr:MBL fold metallo-hydrolase [Jeotgalibacillus terrae]MBM7579434.1 glyoxylase-like metal-dependent hydrolase (beta-lactamase superfamily II) [Jeotgalibacillus terrae]